MITHPAEYRMQRADSFDGDLRSLPNIPPVRRERFEREPPQVVPAPLPNSAPAGASATDTGTTQTGTFAASAPAPSPLISFDGLDFTNWGAGHPPDTNGDVGPTYYVETVNTSIGIYDKSSGSRVAAFTFDTFMSQGHFGNLCDTDNFGDPVVLYDSFEDRWIITDFAFRVDTSGNVVNPPGNFQCIAVSKSGDPVSGGWNFYFINTTGGLGDYPKFGIWPDALYMSANMFDYAATGSFQDVRLYAFNKMQMYAGASTVQVLSFDLPTDQFTVLPANARLQAGTPPAGSPNYYASVWNYLNAVSVWAFHVNWNAISTSTITGPINVTTSTFWAQYSGTNADAPSPKNSLDTLYPRLMLQNQYSNIGGVESLWDSHTVGAGNPTSNVSSSQAAVRYYQLNVTGGNVAGTATQAYTYSPDTTLYRFMPSVAVNSLGDMAIGFSGSNSTTNPVIRFAGRLSTDPVNTITQTEQTLIAGTGTQSGNCGGSACTRWGDYSSMTLDPDGCTFWYAQEYYQISGLDDLTRIGAVRFPTCTQSQLQTGAVQGTVSSGTNPVSGATILFGSRTATTDSNGQYSFASIPAGTYPLISASYPGLNTASVGNIIVSGGGTTTENFSLTTAVTSGCLTDTSQADFQAGVPANCDVTSIPGNVTLLAPATIDVSVSDSNSSGFSFSSTSFPGQTFTPTVTGHLSRVEVFIFCSNCSGTNPNLIAEIHTASGGVPVMGTVLASATAPGTSSGSGFYVVFTFNTPPTLTSGTQYAFIVKLASNRTTGSQAYLVTNGSIYANGTRYVCNSSSCSAPTGQNASSDLQFHTYMNTGFVSSGTFVSSLKDANPAPGANPTWSTISWTASVPSGTSLKFQVAGSNSASGPFNFVGPDGTASTYFASGGSLSRFNGMRYLKYQALLGTSSSATSPTLNDVTVCFSDLQTVVAAQMTSPTPGTALPGSTVTFSWNTGTAINDYQLWVGTSLAGYDLYQGPLQTTTTATVSGLTAPTIYVRLWSKSGSTWLYNDYQYTQAPVAAQITSPTPGTLSVSTVTFNWNTGTAINAYQIWVGTSPAGYDLFQGPLQTTTSATVSGLTAPTIYVRLWSKSGSTWLYNDYQYTQAPVAAQITSPTPGTALTASTVTFAWNTGTVINSYQLWVGTSLGGYNLYEGPLQTTTSATVSGLTAPTIYVRLWSKSGSTWLYNDYQYTQTPVAAQIQSPTPGTAISGSSVTFTWNAGTVVSGYQLWVGTSLAGYNIYQGPLQTTTSVIVSGFTQGTIYVRLWSMSGTTWLYNDYHYTWSP